MSTQYFDVVAVNIDTGKERLLAENLTETNAEAVISMAIMRRGVDVEFYKTVSHAGSKGMLS